MMTSKERMYQTFLGKKVDCMAVTPHWWGLYKFQFGKLLKDYSGEKEAWSLSGKELAQYDKKFYNEFSPDMFHLTTGHSKKGNLYEEKEYQEKKKLLRMMNTKQDIDEFLVYIKESEEEVRESGVFTHVEELAKEYGKEHFITLHEGNPVCRILDEYFGFEDGLIAMLEEPELVGYFLFELYDILLPRMKALKSAGADAYAGSETYCTRDIMSASMYRDIVFPAQKHFYTEIQKIGLVPITYFLGDVVPLLPDINKLGIKGLMVEESKKGFDLDVLKIRQELNPEITLFGNLDSVYLLQQGKKEEVIAETKRQMKAAEFGSFIMSNGCPISFDTPEENIHAMIRTAKENFYV